MSTNTNTLFQALNDKDNELFTSLLTSNDDLKDLNLNLLCDPHGDTLLHYASRTNNIEIVKYLIEEKQCYINMSNYRGATPLYYASLSASNDVVNYLIEKKADPRQVSTFSGLKAADVCKDLNLKKQLTEYALKFEEILYNPVYNFRYRIADHWRTSMLMIRHPNPNFYFGFKPYPEAVVLGKKDLGLLIEECKIQDKKYENYLIGEIRDETNICLLCDSIVENCPKCKFCNKVNICDNCLNSKDVSVAQKVLIHVNNCKSKLYF
ncbi:hypothetical protein ABK040_015373 [Willaertia magna]